MTETPAPPEKMADLSPEVREFLAGLRPDEVKLMKHGIRLINSIMTVSRATRWLIVTLLGILAGVVLLGESVAKIWGWFQRPP